MSLEHLGCIDLPPHVKPGGFDHAAVHRATGRVYVAHTANDALDVIDGNSNRYLRSIPSLAGVAGALVSDEHDLIFTSNRGENTVGIFSPGQESSLVKVPVGMRPNGLAYDPGRSRLLAANVGDPAVPHPFTVSIVDVQKRALIADVAVPGRTRWTVYDQQTDAFYVNIAEPPKIAVIDAGDPTQLARTFDIPAAGPHGLDLDAERARLFCACDGEQLVVLDSRSGRVNNQAEISGVPDVIFFNSSVRRLYVAIGDPGVLEVFDTDRMERLETVQTERGAHTIAFDPERSKIYVFLPQTHRAAVYFDNHPMGAGPR
jgi:DNA-binding beta-propeller fold protein YncE